MVVGVWVGVSMGRCEYSCRGKGRVGGRVGDPKPERLSRSHLGFNPRAYTREPKPETLNPR